MHPIRLIVRRIPMASRTWRTLVRPVWNVANTVEMLWFTREASRRFKAAFTTDAGIRRSKTRLMQSDSNPADPMVTIVLPSRKLGNKDNNMIPLLDSFQDMTQNPERFEVLIKVDDDDYLPFFHGVKQRFPKLNLRFFVSPRLGGYDDIPQFHCDLLEDASPSSQVYIGLSDDGRFSRKGWDQDLFELMNREGAFIMGSKPLSSEMSVIGPLPVKPQPAYYYDCEPYPAVSMNLIKSLGAATEEIEGWCALGKMPALDMFLASLVHILHDKYGVTMYHEVERYCMRVSSRISWANNAKRAAKVSQVSSFFFEPESVEIRNMIAEQLYADETLRLDDGRTLVSG